jgi:hypothetical protein
MAWRIVYFEEDDGTVPGYLFEDQLEKSSDRDVRLLLGLLDRWGKHAAEQGPTGRAAGGHYEKCSNYEFWQVKASRGNKRGRFFFGWDGPRKRMVLLSGIVKEGRSQTSRGAYREAKRQWKRYKETGRIAKGDG